jgi:hypothetical protein
MVSIEDYKISLMNPDIFRVEGCCYPWKATSTGLCLCSVAAIDAAIGCIHVFERHS